jgi:P4 family phage/plasmid primase-like protien
MSELVRYLQSHKEKCGYNLQSLGSINFRAGTFRTETNKQDEFLNIYIKYITNGGISHLLEKPFSESNKPFNKTSSGETLFNNSNQIRIDIDLRFPLTDSELKTKKFVRTYKIKDVEKLIKYYIIEYSKYIEIPSDIKLYVMEKESPTIKNEGKDNQMKKDGIHIMFPGIMVPNKIQYAVHKSIIQNDDLKAIFKSWKVNNSIDEIVDNCVIEKNAWFLLGSGKPNDYVYKVSNIYKLDDEVLKSLNNGGTVDCSDFEIVKNELPNFDTMVKNLSNLMVNKNIKLKENGVHLEDKDIKITRPSNKNVNKIDKIVKKMNNNKRFRNLTNIKYLSKLVNCLSPIRSLKYESWRDIGQALFNCNPSSLPLFHLFSQKDINKYDKQGCDDHWSKCDEYSDKYQSLNQYYLEKCANRDNKQLFEKITNEFSYNIIKDEMINPNVILTHGDDKNMVVHEHTFARGLKILIDHNGRKNYACVFEKKNKTFYVYKNHKWEKDEGNIDLSYYIMHNLCKIFLNMTHELEHTSFRIKQELENLSSSSSSNVLSMNMDDDDDDDDNDGDGDSAVQNEDNVKNMQQMMGDQQHIKRQSICSRKILSYLEKASNMNVIISELSILYSNQRPHFYKELDVNPNVFVCNNGVLDLKTLEFREGSPEDLVTLSCNIEYLSSEEISESFKHQESLLKLQDFLDTIFPELDLLNYTLDIISESLCGVVRRQELFVCTGSGSNGKSKFFEFLTLVFGDYSGKVSPALLTKNRGDANSASPAIADLRGKRLVTCQEPDENEKFKTGVMKELTGADPLTGRQLHMPLITFIPQYKMYIQCNDKPDVDSTDDGTWRRLKVINYIAKFVESDDEKLKNTRKYPYHFEKDPNLTESFIEWAPIMLNMLFDRYKELTKRKFNHLIPKSVESAIKEYKEQHNVYAEFVKDKMIMTPGESLSVNDGFKEFTDYCKESNIICKTKRNDFRRDIERIIGCTAINNQSVWRNWSLLDETQMGNDSD